MIFTESMQQVVAVVLDHHADEVTRELLRLGLLHFVSVTEVDPDVGSQVEAVVPTVAETAIAEIRRRIEGLLAMVNRRPPEGADLRVEDLRAVNLEETTRVLDALADRVQGIRNRQGALQQEILRLEDIQRQLHMFGTLGGVVEARSQYSYLSVQTGSIRSSELESFEQAFQDIPNVSMELGVREGEPLLLLITMKRDEAVVDSILEKIGWTEVHLPKELSGKEDQVQEELQGKLRQLKGEQAELKSQVESLIREKQTELPARSSFPAGFLRAGGLWSPKRCAKPRAAAATWSGIRAGKCRETRKDRFRSG